MSASDKIESVFPAYTGELEMLIAMSDSVFADVRVNFLTKLHFLNSGNKIRSFAAHSVVLRGANFTLPLFL